MGRFAENLLSSYSTDLASLMDPTQFLKESKANYLRYNELLEESERLDSQNSE